MRIKQKRVTEAALALSLMITLVTTSAGAITLSPGQVIVAGTGVAGTGLTRIDPVTGAQTLISSGGFGDFALADSGTIYGLESGAVVRVDVATGAKTTLSSGGLLIDPAAISVDALGRIQVFDQGPAGVGGSIVTIDPGTGSQQMLTNGGFITSPHAPHIADLETDSSGRLILLDAGRFGQSNLIAIDPLSGDQLDLYLDARDAPLGSSFLFSGTGLGIAPDGDVFAVNGTSHSTGVLRVDPATGVASAAGSVTAPCVGGTCIEYTNNDIAFADDGVAWLVGQGIAAQNGLFRFDGQVRPLDGDPSFTPFSVGDFNEVQVVSSAHLVPEPGTALLVGLGLALASRQRTARRSNARR